jgi:hypothetical protein
VQWWVAASVCSWNLGLKGKFCQGSWAGDWNYEGKLWKDGLERIKKERKNSLGWATRESRVIAVRKLSSTRDGSLQSSHQRERDSYLRRAF